MKGINQFIKVIHFKMEFRTVKNEKRLYDIIQPERNIQSCTSASNNAELIDNNYENFNLTKTT
jgi:hypothetical protein